jgi:hypothetical protein
MKVVPESVDWNAPNSQPIKSRFGSVGATAMQLLYWPWLPAWLESDWVPLASAQCIPPSVELRTAYIDRWSVVAFAGCTLEATAYMNKGSIAHEAKEVRAMPWANLIRLRGGGAGILASGTAVKMRLPVDQSPWKIP